MTYKETCDYLYKQTPMFESQGVGAYKEGLENTLKLDEHFGHPHRDFRTIHVAGTNGKGSCAHTISAILQECGYKVGLYTSPHLVDFSERIRINGCPIAENYVVDFVEKEKAFFEPLHPSFFEVTTALAFKYFRDMQVDIAVIEVGLGGRLDCTNIITPILSVITNISFDHTQLLGNSLKQIAMEKAGIIKKGVPVVIGETTPETRVVFESVASEVGAPITYAEDTPEVLSVSLQNGKMHYDTRSFGQLEGELCGIYQEKNTNTVLHAVKELEKQGYLYLDKHDDGSSKCQEVTEGFAEVSRITGLKGRWQVISEAPLTVCDTGHNVAGWTYLSQQISQVECFRKHIVFGAVEDKDIDGMMALLPKDAIYYFTKAKNHRAISENVLKVLGNQIGLKGESYPSVAVAVEAARSEAVKGDFIFIGGSSYIVADFLKSYI